MMLSLSDFFGEGDLVALVSDRSVDFALNENTLPLTDGQREVLRKGTKISIERIAWTRQVHGNDVIEADEQFLGREALCEADGILTAQIGLAIAVRTADCLPVFIFDSVKNVIGLVHAGWKGSYKQILCLAIDQMVRKWKTNPAHLKIVFGPAIRLCCYQVGEEFLSYFPQDTHRRDGGLYLDLIAVNRRQALESGAREENIFDSKMCTCCDKRFFSFRREGSKAGRMLSMMMLKRHLNATREMGI